jgi:hypothetical protein
MPPFIETSSGDDLSAMKLAKSIVGRQSSNFSRRGAMGLLGGALLAGSPLLSRAYASQMTVVYLGAKDCGVCQRFDAYEKNAFKARVTAKGMSFREVKVDSLRYIRQIEGWPADLMWLHNRLQTEAGVPWFFVVQGNQIVSETQRSTAIV